VTEVVHTNFVNCDDEERCLCCVGSIDSHAVCWTADAGHFSWRPRATSQSTA